MTLRDSQKSLALGNLRVVSRDDLLERYLNTIREQAIEAERLNEYLVLLIFGHGSLDHHVSVGNHFLEMKDLQRILQGKSLVTIFPVTREVDLSSQITEINR